MYFGVSIVKLIETIYSSLWDNSRESKASFDGGQYEE